jgi:hypothetical protein
MSRAIAQKHEVDHKKVKGIVLLIAIAFLLAIPTQYAEAQGKSGGKGSSGQRGGKGSTSSGKQSGRTAQNLGNVSGVGALAPAPLEQLMRMRDEEKLAHDVYVALAKSSGLPIFKNISNAELQHRRALEQVVSRYSPTTPATSLPVGNFTDPQSQKLYDALVASGSVSPLAAAMVGVKVEEMDIKDLQNLLSQNPPQDVARVLENLLRASSNHLRAFSTELTKLGGVYKPEFLSPQEFNSIVNASSQRGEGGSRANDPGTRQAVPEGNTRGRQAGSQAPKGNGKRGAGPR